MIQWLRFHFSMQDDEDSILVGNKGPSIAKTIKIINKIFVLKMLIKKENKLF